jgi:catechol 2,3-dioxygenase-like lactoylglutathione lyase family enzyme
MGMVSEMVKTHGLTHISLAVRDPERSLKFYSEVFGIREYFRDESQIQAQSPGRTMSLRSRRLNQPQG